MKVRFLVAVQLLRLLLLPAQLRGLHEGAFSGAVQLLLLPAQLCGLHEGAFPGAV
jgi:hypothetical protein